MRDVIYKVVTILLIAALSEGEIPEDDFRIINKQDLLATDIDLFVDNSSKSFSQLLFDVARDQIVVGARDVLYRLSLRRLQQLERAEWPASIDKMQQCQDKGQTEDDCHNYIKVLLMYGHKLFACGTNAFSPECSWREVENVTAVSQQLGGVTYCPYSPRSNVTAILTAGGEYYAGTSANFASTYYVISRSRGAAIHDSRTLRNPQYAPNWLNEPQFVGSFEDDTYVYFVFREMAVEFMNCGKIVYSRIARVCKNDSGGYRQMNNNYWSTFLKARLKCPVPGDVPFHYDEVQDIEYLSQERILIATFTTSANGVPGSAVCIYNMSDVEAAFEGPFKVQQSLTSTWEPHNLSKETRDRFRCVKDTSHQSVEFDHDYNLMYEAVQPTLGAPVYKAALRRFTQVTVDITSTNSLKKQLVLYVATQNGEVLKLAVWPSLNGACLVEVWRLRDADGGYDVQSMQFVKETMSVYIGSETGVLRIGSERCARYSSKESCLRTADPYCGWDSARGICTRASAHIGDAHFLQDTVTCADDVSVDGGWSSWSEWEECTQHGTGVGGGVDDKPDMCLCRRRRCDNPAPRHGGRSCQGVSVSVTNCTQHGGWSPWSSWSECSATCGIAVKSRRRSCSSPTPQYGGRVCIGMDVDHMYCTNLPPCPDPAFAPIDGGWSTWSVWSECSPVSGVGCGAGAGVKERRRTCTNPVPKNGGADCEGSKTERQPCDLKPCEIKKATAWSPWVQIPNNISDGGYIERRFKFTCKAPSSEQIRLSLAREEERYCTATGACSSTPLEEDGGWEPWGPWSPCSAACGGGQQSRSRRCRKLPCTGAPDMLRACNTQACSGEWSCWSDWSECIGGCGSGGVSGRRTRSRRCLSPSGCADAGAALENRLCVPTCTLVQESESSWGPWGSWSECTSGERVRRRGCTAGACVGPQLQVAICGEDAEMDNEVYAMSAYRDDVEIASFVTLTDNDSLSVGGIVGCAMAAFLIGWIMCLSCVTFYLRRGGSLLRGRSRVPSSPHYITAKQNSYVTIPLKDVPRKAKRQPSFTGIGGSSGVILPKSNNISNVNQNNASPTPKLYPKAMANEYETMGTLKKHSNQPTHKNNFDFEEKFY